MSAGQSGYLREWRAIPGGTVRPVPDRWEWLRHLATIPLIATTDIERAERSRLMWGVRPDYGPNVAVLSPLGLFNTFRLALGRPVLELRFPSEAVAAAAEQAEHWRREAVALGWERRRVDGGLTVADKAARYDDLRDRLDATLGPDWGGRLGGLIDHVECGEDAELPHTAREDRNLVRTLKAIRDSLS